MLEGMFGFEVALKRFGLARKLALRSLRFGLSYFAMPIPQSPLNIRPIRR